MVHCSCRLNLSQPLPASRATSTSPICAQPSTRNDKHHSTPHSHCRGSQQTSSSVPWRFHHQLQQQHAPWHLQNQPPVIAVTKSGSWGQDQLLLLHPSTLCWQLSLQTTMVPSLVLGMISVHPNLLLSLHAGVILVLNFKTTTPHKDTCRSCQFCFHRCSR